MSINLKEIRKTINISSSKNNNFLIFFTIFILYILISVLGTSDLMLLLPEHTFKMPLINFDLNLISFYILAPIMLFLLHFNILFNYNMYLKKIDVHYNQIDMETIDPSVYGYAYTLANRGLGGFLINLFLWIWIYLIPLIVLIFIYLRFADYHHQGITVFHLVMVLGDIILIFLSFYYNNIHLKHAQMSIRILSGIFRFLLLLVFILGGLHYLFIFTPVIQEIPDPRIKLVLDKENCDTNISQMYKFFVVKNKDITMPANCFPRLVVNEAEMAKISPSALYLPRFLVEDNDKIGGLSDEEKEKQLILEYGARSNLIHRNLRYAKLYGCILTRADLSYSDLQGSDLRKSHLQAAKLIGAKLQNANLIGAKLDKTELEDANLTRANLTAIVSKGGQFYLSTLIHSTMVAMNLEKADFLEANLTGADLQNSRLTYSNFHKADFTKANLRGNALTRSNFSGSNFSESNLTEVSFYEAELNDSNFSKAILTAASLRGSNLSSTDFTDTILISVDFSETYTDNEDSNVSLKTILKSAKEVGGIIIQDIKSIKDKKPDRRYYTDKNLTGCEKYLTIKLENSDVDLKVTKRRIKYLIKGVKKYTNHIGKPIDEECTDINSTKLSQTLQFILNTECSFLETFLDLNPRFNKIYAQTIIDCKKDYTKKETKD